MSRKRRNTSSPEADDFPSPKRLNTGLDEEQWTSSDEGEVDETPRIDQQTGQTGAFPGLGDDDGQLFYGPAADGLDYLRMVRSEARGVPFILTAPSTTSHPNAIENARTEHEDEGGYFEDGTYTAKAFASKDPVETLPPAQRHYHDSLLRHFRLARATVRCTPPLSAIESLRSSQLISFPEESRKARLQWEEHIMNADPSPTQIACMDAQSVMELVKLIRKKLPLLFRPKNVETIKRAGSWLWAVLAKSRDREELSSDEIGEIRQLAQRAIQMSQRQPDQIEEVSKDIGSEDGEVEDDDAGQDIETDELKDPTVKEQIGDGDDDDEACDGLISTTLDMVMTVVGEVYGQRDLLNSRKVWAD
ncbi:hypothetical protein PV10_08114 [Exophiala mesophila]|uniref:Uncharacterized protein n=1 Tax=Exophiala mesophila TaxID=212818 RepID=A0A0D1Z3F9_EXOME|nr:uncharacterized protein PV10_08114 [Exophiala mesophila]KIV88429.1 hypothetical protein PV10_08114 [Exophiala mesophila]